MLDFDKIEAVTEAAPAPPWTLHGEGWAERWACNDRDHELLVAPREQAAALRFAVQDREDVPALCAELRQARAEAEQLRKALTEALDGWEEGLPWTGEVVSDPADQMKTIEQLRGLLGAPEASR